MEWILFPILLLLLLPNSCGEHVLGLFLHPGYSHFHSYYPLLAALAERGHDVKTVTFFPMKDHPTRYEEILLEGKYALNGMSMDDIQPSRSVLKLIREYFILEKEGKDACNRFYKSGVVEKILEAHSKKRFDLTVVEVFNTDCMLGVVELIKTPIIGLSSCAMMPWHYDRVANPDFPSFIPSEFIGSSSEMSFAERLTNFFIVKLTKLLYRYSQLEDNRIIHEHLGLEIDVRNVVKNTAIILVNQHYSLSGPRPLSSRVIEIGGAHIPTETKPLPNELENFLNLSKEGVFYISWGSMVNFSSMPSKLLTDIVNALSKFEENIVWKYETNVTYTNSKKFFFSKWIPQFDLLCHPKVKLFWSHGGLLGTSESVHCAVPMVITPMYGDQYLNAKAIQYRKVGEILDYHAISEENLYNTISKVLQLDYSRNAKYVSDVFRNRQNTPLETAVWWMEHVLRTKGSNLTYSTSVNMHWFSYYSIDAILVLLMIGAVIMFMPLLCLRKLSIILPKQRSVSQVNVAAKKKKKY